MSWHDMSSNARRLRGGSVCTKQAVEGQVKAGLAGGGRTLSGRNESENIAKWVELE